MFKNIIFFFIVLFCASNFFSQTSSPTPNITKSDDAFVVAKPGKNPNKNEQGRSDKRILNYSATLLVAPIYPKEAAEAGAGGIVEVEVRVGENGRVVSAKAVSGHPLLRKLAEDAAKASHFNSRFFELVKEISGILVFDFAQVTPVDPSKTNFINNKARKLVEPKYSKAAMKARAAGVVQVEVTIDENGDVISAKAISGHPLLRTSAEDAALKSKFTKNYNKGVSTQITGIILYNFVPF